MQFPDYMTSYRPGEITASVPAGVHWRASPEGMPLWGPNRFWPGSGLVLRCLGPGFTFLALGPRFRPIFIFNGGQFTVPVLSSAHTSHPYIVRSLRVQGIGAAITDSYRSVHPVSTYRIYAVPQCALFFYLQLR